MLAQLVSVASFVARMHWTASLRLRDGTITAPRYWYLGHVAVAGCIAVLILATALAGRVGQFPFANLPMRIVGQVSYGMYLWHALVITLIVDYPMITHWGSISKFKFLLLLVLPLSFILGTLSYKLVEAPLMHRRSGAGGNSRDASAGGRFSHARNVDKR